MILASKNIDGIYDNRSPHGMHHRYRLYVYERTEYVGGEICFTIQQPVSELKCSVCESKED